jgi:hypothetical protein
LTTLAEKNQIDDSDCLISDALSAQQVDAALKSLLVDNYIVLDVISKQSLELTKEGAGYAANGTPEY